MQGKHFEVGDRETYLGITFKVQVGGGGRKNGFRNLYFFCYL
jgi:hypothetical protein